MRHLIRGLEVRTGDLGVESCMTCESVEEEFDLQTFLWEQGDSYTGDRASAHLQGEDRWSVHR